MKNRNTYANSMFKTIDGLIPKGVGKLPASGKAKTKHIKKIVRYYKFANITRGL